MHFPRHSTYVILALRQIKENGRVDILMDDNRLAQVHLGTSVGVLCIAIRGGGGWAMWVLIGFSALFAMSAILLWTKLELVKKLLRRASVDFFPLFLGLVLLGLAFLEKVNLVLGIIVEIAAFLYLYIRLYKQTRRAKARD